MGGGILVRVFKREDEMIIKSSVRFKTINKYGVQFFAAVLKCEEVMGLPITITSGNDSVHKPSNGSLSFHGEDKAWDIRINDISHEQAEQRREFLKAWLGYGWDVIIERFDDPANDHIHCERDTRQYPEIA